MVEFFQCVSFFVMSVARKRIREFDAQHPYSPAREAWRAWRAEHVAASAGEDSSDCTATYIYLDDQLGATPLQQGEPLESRTDADEQPVQISLHVERQTEGTFTVKVMLFAEFSRPQTHLEISKRTFEEAGWSVAIDKLQLGFAIDELGLHCSTHGDGITAVPEAKRQGMIQDIISQQPVPEGTLAASSSVPRDDMERLVGRCGHIAQVAPEANAFMAPMHRMLHAKIVIYTRGHRRLRVQPSRYDVANAAPAAREYQLALRWWRHALESHISVPLAPQLTFPALSESGVGFMFTDAAREDGT